MASIAPMIKLLGENMALKQSRHKWERVGEGIEVCAHCDRRRLKRALAPTEEGGTIYYSIVHWNKTEDDPAHGDEPSRPADTTRESSYAGRCTRRVCRTCNTVVMNTVRNEQGYVCACSEGEVDE